MPETRGARGRSYTLITPDNHYASRVPGLPDARVIKLVTPRLAPAQFAQYLVAVAQQPIDLQIAAGVEHCFFALGGTLTVRQDDEAIELGTRGFIYLPDDRPFSIATAADSTRFLWIKRRHDPASDERRPPRVSGLASESSFMTTQTPGLRRCELLPPDDPCFDFNMSLLAFDAGFGLAQIEIHDEEHGLYMTRGSGQYVLERDAYSVRTDDFIYMAPYCPQGFTAGGQGAEYLLYKDVYREVL